MRKFAGLALAFAVSACSDSTSPDTTTVISNDWQVVIQAGQSNEVLTVAGMRQDAFTPLSAEDFYMTPMVFDVKAGDTARVAYALQTSILKSNFQKTSVTWTFQGNMAPSADDSKVQIGSPVFLHQDYRFKDNDLISTTPGTATVSLIGNDFKVTRPVSLVGVDEVFGFNLVVRPIVCVKFGVRTIASTGLTEIITDGTTTETRRYTVPEIKVTCNPKAPSIREVSPRATRLVDLLRVRLSS